MNNALEIWSIKQMAEVVSRSYRKSWDDASRIIKSPFGFAPFVLQCQSRIEVVDGEPTVIVTCDRFDDKRMFNLASMTEAARNRRALQSPEARADEYTNGYGDFGPARRYVDGLWREFDVLRKSDRKPNWLRLAFGLGDIGATA